MSDPAETPSPQQQRPKLTTRLGRGLSWLLLTLLKVIVIVGLVGLLGAGGWFGYQTYIDVTSRADKTNQQIATLEASFASAVATVESVENRVALVATQDASRADALASLNDQLGQGAVALDALEATMSVELLAVATVDAAQKRQLTAMTTNLDTLQAEIGAEGDEVTSLNSDIDLLTSQLGAYDDALSQLEVGLTTLDETVAGYDTPERELARIQQILYLFRTWEMIGRAQHRLSEGNAGLAAQDTTMALEAVERVVGSSAEAVTTELLAVRQRLLLAQDSLPDDPVSAERDLETAWESLDVLIVALIGDVSTIVPPPSGLPQVTATPSVEAIQTPTPTATPTSSDS